MAKLMAEYNFQADLESSISNADPKLDKKELLVDIFKMYVAKLFELKLKDSRLEFGVLVQIKSNLINEFRKASLAEIQMSVEQYEKLFDDTVKEIFNDAAIAHKGVDIMSQDPNVEFSINPNAMKKTASGLFVPSSN
jgi:hypothetical protein